MKMKKQLKFGVCMWMVLLCVAAVLNSCTETEEPEPMTNEQLVGLWGISQSEIPASQDEYDEYYRFYGDGTMESIFISDSAYNYSQGTFEIVEDQVRVTLSTRRAFVKDKDNIVRYAAHYDQSYTLNWMLTLKTISPDLMSFTTPTRSFYFHRTAALRADWDEEFSEAAITPTEENLSGQWDAISYFVRTSKGTRCWGFTDPANYGLMLLADNAVENRRFWPDRVAEYLVAAGAIANDAIITVLPEHCSWRLTNSTLTLGCTTYFVNADENGKATYIGPITPEKPIERSFQIYEMTAHYLILFHHESGRYFAFHKPTQAASAAPARQGIRVGNTGRSRQAPKQHGEHAAEAAFGDKIINSALFR